MESKDIATDPAYPRKTEYPAGSIAAKWCEHLHDHVTGAFPRSVGQALMSTRRPGAMEWETTYDFEPNSIFLTRDFCKRWSDLG